MNTIIKKQDIFVQGYEAAQVRDMNCPYEHSLATIWQKGYSQYLVDSNNAYHQGYSDEEAGKEGVYFSNPYLAMRYQTGREHALKLM